MTSDKYTTLPYTHTKPSYAYTTAPCAYTAFPYAYTTAPYATIPLSPRAGEGDIGGEGSALQIRATDYTLTRTPDGGLLLELAGKVRVEYQGRRLEGERLLLDTDAALVRSEEPFRLFAERGVLTGQRGEYFYGQARGRFEGVQANVLGVYLDAASLEGDLTDFEARAVVVSTCDPFRPPIQVRAGRVRLVRGARLTLRNARLFVYGQPLLTLPQFTVRVGETAEVVSLPSPVYSAETGWGARARLELPLGERTLLQASAASYLRVVPEVRAAVGVALRGDEPALGDPDLRLRFEQSALYNLRVRPERTPPADALTLRAEIARDVRPLLAPRERLRVSRTELALIAPLQYAGGFGEASLRYGSLSERIDGQRTPTRERLALERRLVPAAAWARRVATAPAPVGELRTLHGRRRLPVAAPATGAALAAQQFADADGGLRARLHARR
jgi:hypothetical protein